MTPWEGLAVFAAGAGAGTINVIVGSGTLITFPVLLAIGLPPVTANVSNTLGLVPGSISGAIGYRQELVGQRRRLLRLGVASLLGGLLGAVLLTRLPGSAFNAIVPVLILLALVLVVIQPRVARAVAARGGAPAHPDGSWALVLGIFCCGIYGGYFGAAQGVLMLALMGMLLRDDLQRMNAVKNVLALIVNAVAAVFFMFTTHMDWLAALLIAAGSTIGGLIGAKVGRRLPPIALRTLIVLVGLAAVTKLLIG
ncbi:sulfite exporter TauE/SafE family protein [Kitasatospora acidiphila]|uniref:Probable membrane transporter protein n=1 Tax=Kitasatospora acidiphila TaxID=2567942 RepID=A0A540W1L1_9ACTN|nr:sulfite exporter TauE/SafE family protein [Kitasatospora acidiphila]TQF02905.1 sulfite exporter TauE/SafE family protein [Kitasatospora acidiphila]